MTTTMTVIVTIMVIVPVLTLDDLEQLVFVRKSIEVELARRAARQISPDLVQELEQIDAALDGAISNGDVAGYLAQNHRFHTALYAQANAPVLTDQAERLWLRFGRLHVAAAPVVVAWRMLHCRAPEE